METHGQKVGELIDAMNDGFILFKDHHDDLFDTREYIFYNGISYELKGWASALGNPEERIMEIIKYPERWKIFPNFNMNKDDYPFPWSTKWKDKNR
ncbi:MAG: hypothetical protein M0R03_22955 [Novosphingobium sp.]|nr:hypothetical protein [Novosphingobium sp.]